MPFYTELAIRGNNYFSITIIYIFEYVNEYVNEITIQTVFHRISFNLFINL